MKIRIAGTAGYAGLSEDSPQRIHFCPDWYLQTYPDVAAAGIDPLQHYLAYGRNEGRLPRENRACLLEAKLWGGFSQWARKGLEEVLADAEASTDERAYAAWVLAGWLAFQDSDWRRVAILAAQARAANSPTHSGPILLESDALRRAGRLIDARCLLRRALTQQPNTPDLYLAYANAWSDGPDLRRLDWINRALLAGNLAAVEVRDSGQALSLDHLVVASPALAMETSSQPKISVIVPLCNAQATVMTALHSLLQQTWRNIEVLVVDDCSSDGGLELVCEVAKQDDRLVLLRHGTNLGAYAARNTGLARATGDFVTTHDADDWSHPQKLALQAKALLVSPTSRASVSHWVRCSSALVFSQQHPQANWVHCNASSLMFRRQVVETLGFWDAVTVGADAEYYYRILSIYGRQAIKEVLPGVPLAFGRHHPDSLTQRSETHARGLYYGLRREYQESFDAWHGQIKRARFSPLSAKPLSRPFPAPETMLRQAPAKEIRRLVVADFSAASQQAARVEDCLQHLSGLGGPLAVFHLSDVTRPALGRVSERVRTLMREHGVLTVLPGQKVRCSTLFLWTHGGLALPLDDAPTVEVLDHAWLLAEQCLAQERPTLPAWIGCAGPLQYAVAGLLKSRAAWEVLDSGLFDSDWYLRRYPDLAEMRVDGLWHFLAHGVHEDRDPGPGFSSSGYRARYLARDVDVPEVSAEAPELGALGDYLQHGREQGFEPLPIFEGTLTLRASAPTVLVCAHLAGPYLFGAEISFLDVLDALKRLGINVLVSLPGVHHLGYLAAVRQRAVRVAVLPYGWWKHGVAPCAQTVTHFQRFMQANKVDFVYLNTLVLDDPMLAARALNLSVIVHVRELPEHDSTLCGLLGASAAQIRQHLRAGADLLIANSQTVMHYLLDAHNKAQSPTPPIPSPPIHVVPDIVHCSGFDLPLPSGSAPFNVAMISSNTLKKGLADVVEMAGELALLSPEIRCLLIGPETPTITTLRAQQSKGLVSANLVFCGYAATPQEALAEAHVVVNLSHVQESFGRTVLEAMAARRPVVCYDWGALSELVVDGETGFLVPAGDVKAAAARIHLLLQSAQLRGQMGEAARARADRRFGPAALDASLGTALARCKFVTIPNEA
ncbi:MAG: glycosyltransferase [Candidatus Accumulibacter propinquus]|jgi:glycosyltransferase involved in cell wall biosynthesis|uniref:glycosyltransferase n=1 Tax=Candidatus Accumulibacter propinquus TaxID=2954380 RepID=UPI002FC2E9E0